MRQPLLFLLWKKTKNSFNPSEQSELAKPCKQVQTNLALKKFYHCEVFKNSLLKTQHSTLKTLSTFN